MSKHAYLIIANRNFEQLAQLVKVLDDERNDIYIQIDRTSREHRVAIETKKSVLKIPDEIPIYWGDYSQIQAELNLFSAAAVQHYDFYHLMSGLDLPLANQDEIHDFFSQHYGQQFVTFSAQQTDVQLRVRMMPHTFRHHFREQSDGFLSLIARLYRRMENKALSITAAAKTSVDKIEYGSNWVSLSDDFVQCMVNPDNLKRIRSKFSKGYLVDELLVPFELNDLGFRDTVYYSQPVNDLPREFQGNLRYINWWDGKPYTWREKDFDTLIRAKRMGHLFSRKFDENIDADIVQSVVQLSLNK